MELGLVKGANSHHRGVDGRGGGDVYQDPVYERAPLPLPLPAPRVEKQPKLIVASRNFVLDNALNAKAAHDLRMRKMEDLNSRKDKLAFGPGARGVRKENGSKDVKGGEGKAKRPHVPEQRDDEYAAPSRMQIPLAAASVMVSQSVHSAPNASSGQSRSEKLPASHDPGPYVLPSQASYLNHYGKQKAHSVGQPKKDRHVYDPRGDDDVSSISMSMQQQSVVSKKTEKGVVLPALPGRMGQKW